MILDDDKLICFPNFNCTNVLFDSVWTNWHWKLKLNCVSYLVFGCKQFCAIFSSWSCSNEMHFFLERPWRQVSNMILKVKIYPHEFHFCSLRLLTPKVCEKDKRTFILIQMMVKVIRKKIEQGQLKNNKGNAYLSLRLCYLFFKICYTLPQYLQF